MADELVDDAARSSRRAALVGAALVVAVVVVGAVVRSTLPPPPPSVTLADLSGSALENDSFVRLHLSLRAQGVRDLGDATLIVAGATQRGQQTSRFDDGRLTLQVDVTPACDALTGPVDAGLLELSLLDQDGRPQEVQVTVPADGALERLLRYRCR